MVEARTTESHRSSFANSKPEVDTGQKLIRLLEPEESRQKIWATESADEKSDLEIEEDDIDEFKVLTERNIKQDNDATFYRELSDVTEESEHDQNTQKAAEIHRTRKYEKENLVVSSDDYDRADQEEELYSSVSRSARSENEAPDRADESDDNCIGVLADIPAEILRDRQAILEKLRELKKLSPELKRKNRLLQYWVSRVMIKKHQTMTPEDETLEPGDSEERYIKRLISCKITIDEIEARQSHIYVELNNLEDSLKRVLEEDNQVLGGLVDREREIGVGLVLEKSGRVISLKVVEAMIRRQVIRRDLLNRNRFNYIFRQHRYEDLKMKLRLVETLGEGMTLMDYEEIRLVNYSERDKLEEREKELEKLYIKVQELLNTLSHYKERDIVNQADIYHEKCRLEIIRSEVLTTREEFNKVRHDLSRIRQVCVNHKLRGEMLFAIPVIREMEKTLKTLNYLKAEIERMVAQVRSYPEEHSRQVRSAGTAVPAAGKLQVAGARTTITRMTKVKRSGPRPGRC